ncbi:hypothetical protein DICVIV_12680 [Dictyocaulus viviparus]|uniref:Uncharacterized protein n=1 Tax=Dictyocaulus viviparus TaxID=29172 RepID=A0A0D8X9T3_DICVI|nr:hypothetical protein DICVIV_12680 [Dictyocaulus viviparus]
MRNAFCTYRHHITELAIITNQATQQQKTVSSLDSGSLGFEKQQRPIRWLRINEKGVAKLNLMTNVQSRSARSDNYRPPLLSRSLPYYDKCDVCIFRSSRIGISCPRYDENNTPRNILDKQFLQQFEKDHVYKPLSGCYFTESTVPQRMCQYNTQLSSQDRCSIIQRVVMLALVLFSIAFITTSSVILFISVT